MNKLIIFALIAFFNLIAYAEVCTKAHFEKFIGHYSINSRSCNGIYGTDHCENGWSTSSEDRSYVIRGADVTIDTKNSLALNIVLSSLKNKGSVEKADREFKLMASDKSVQCTQKDGHPFISYKTSTTETTLELPFEETVWFSHTIQVKYEGKIKPVKKSLGFNLEKYYDPKIIVNLLKEFKNTNGDTAEIERNLSKAFYANTKVYLEESEKLFQDKFVCATWILMNEKSSYSAQQFIDFANDVFSKNDSRLKMFVNNVKRQEKALQTSSFGNSSPANTQAQSKLLVCKK